VLLPALTGLLSLAVIFVRDPKMSSPGYHWASSTFLDLDRETELGFLAHKGNSDDLPSQISDRGN
jgi:hypothetical protein